MKTRIATLLLALALATPAAAQTQAQWDSARAVLVSSRGFIRASETELTKLLARHDSLYAAWKRGQIALPPIEPADTVAPPPADTTTPVPPPPPPPPSGSYSAPDLAFTDFNSGSTAPFMTADGGTIGNADIVLTGGQARMRYARLDRSASADVNRALRWVHPTGVGLGQTVYFRGHVTVPTPAANMALAMRKLFYVQRQQNDASFAVVKLEGNKLKAEITGNRIWTFATVPFDQRASIEVQITGSSAVGAANGIFRVWLDGVLVLDRSDINWFTSTAPFKVFLFGQQTQHQLNDLSVTFDEFRFWDNLAVSTKRIGP